MANKTWTKTIVNRMKLKARGDAVEQELDELLIAKDLTFNDLDLTMALESDFGPDWRRRIERVSDNAMEAIITSGTFNKMISAVIRTSLQETPEEEFVLLNMVPKETKDECEGGWKDFGVFSEPEVHETCELELPPLYGIATDYLQHPTGKEGAVGMAWTRQALCRDPNGFLSKEVAKLRKAHDRHRENKLLDAFIGYTPSYDRSGTLYDTYYEDGTATPFETDGPWVNASANRFNCPHDLTQVKELFWDMTDPIHGRAIDMDTDNLQLITSLQNADRIRPLVMAQQIETDDSCNGTPTKWIMTAEVANGIKFDIRAYRRFVDRIMLRYAVTRTVAEDWWWVGKVDEFIAWVTQVGTEVSRCPLGQEECRRQIVAIYNSYSKGYPYIKDPHKGVLMTGTDSGST